MTDVVQTIATSTYLSIQLPLDSLPATFTRDGSGNVLTMVVNYYGVPTNGGAQTTITYTKTFTYADGFCSGYSGWEPPA